MYVCLRGSTLFTESECNDSLFKQRTTYTLTVAEKRSELKYYLRRVCFVSDVALIIKCEGKWRSGNRCAIVLRDWHQLVR